MAKCRKIDPVIHILSPVASLTVEQENIVWKFHKFDKMLIQEALSLYANATT
jgi:hypothetical protein